MKAQLQKVYIKTDEPKPGFTGWAIHDPSFEKKELKKPEFMDALIENEATETLKKTVAEINDNYLNAEMDTILEGGRKKKAVKKLTLWQSVLKLVKP